MSKKNGMGPIISAFLGATFFAVPYIGLGISVLPSLGIGIAAFGASNMLLSESKSKEVVSTDKTFYEILNDAKKQNAQIYALINKVEDEEVQKNIKEIHETAQKIIDTISKRPKKLEQVDSFFNYYLPVTLKILTKYDDIENQRLYGSESKKFMDSTASMLIKINKSFKIQLANLYESDMIDTDAEMKVFEAMLKSDGINDINDFNIK